MQTTNLTSSNANNGDEAQLCSLLGLLTQQRLVKQWSKSPTPTRDLRDECNTLISDASVRKAFALYLYKNPAVQQSVISFLSYLAAVSSLKPSMITGPAAIVAPAGARIASWIPTYLVIDGPLGRVLRDPDSPLNIALRLRHNDFPILCEARDLFNSQVFSHVRNAIGHWSFSLKVYDMQRADLVCYDDRSGIQTIKISREFAEALHFVSFTIILSLDKYVFSVVQKEGG